MSNEHIILGVGMQIILHLRISSVTKIFPDGMYPARAEFLASRVSAIPRELGSVTGDNTKRNIYKILARLREEVSTY